MEVSEAGHEIKYFGFRRVATGVIFLCCLNDQIDHVRETTATAATFFHGVVDFCRYDKLPTVIVKKFVDDFSDFCVSYVVTAADKHVFIPNMTITIVFFAKEDDCCQEKISPKSPDPVHRLFKLR
ncbi:hypothetical protein ASC90_06440 [Rhizobium sp. Root1220]|nr:hypothetical protein ASC90_06440 [Rhizobium sp. Root1220]